MKKTTGGKFDPKDPYLYFLASSPDRHITAQDAQPDAGIYSHPHVLVAVNEITGNRTRSIFDRLCDERRVLLDSGVYNLTVTHARNRGMHMNDALALHPQELDGFTQLWDAYGEIVTEYGDRLWGVVELDLGGPKVKPETRAMIEREFGIVPMPVFHPVTDGWEYYENLVKEYDRLCVGNTVQASRNEREKLLFAIYERTRRHPETWHHLLGVTPSPMMVSLPVHGSSDSSTWLTGIRWQASWRAAAATKPLVKYGPKMAYMEAKGDVGVLAISMACAATMEDTIRTMRTAHA